MNRLLDLDSTLWRPQPDRPAEPVAVESLSGATIVISDYQAAPFGVEALPAHHRNLAPLLEKRLRDAGDIDGLARVITHAQERQGDLAQVCYTAVPLAVSLRYRRWIQRHGDHLLLFPLLDALLLLARHQGLDNGALAFCHGHSIDVLVLQDGRAMHASRQRLYDQAGDDHSRIAAYIAAHLDAFPSPFTIRDDPPRAGCLLIERDPAESQPLAEALNARGVPLSAPSLAASRLFDALKLKRADLDGVSRALYGVSRALPWVAATLMTLCLASAAGALYWRHEAHTLQEALRQAQTQSVGATIREIGHALHSADELALSQRERADFVRLAERVRQTPDPASLIQHLRQAIPEGVELVEAGIVSDDTGVLIIVAGRSASVAAPFSAEEQFVTALGELGYAVVRREITSGIGNSLFRLALTWSEG